MSKGSIFAHPYTSLEHSDPFNKNVFAINWIFFNICNFKCSYCVPNLYDGTVRGVELPVVKKFVERLFQQIKDKTLFFEFTGGEITYYKHFNELFSFIKSLGGSTGILTNGSRDKTWWDENIDLIDHVNISFHPEHMSPDIFFDTLKHLLGRSTIHVNLMMLQEHFDSTYRLAQRIVNELEGISVALQPLFKGFSGSMFDYTPEQLVLLKTPLNRNAVDYQYTLPSGYKEKIFRGSMVEKYANGDAIQVDPHFIIAKQENSWWGWECDIGLEGINISGEGYVFKSVCMGNQGLGHISDDDFQLPKTGVFCPKKKCTCATDIMVTKRKPSWI
jgi:organic radical activating enzyme